MSSFTPIFKKLPLARQILSRWPLQIDSIRAAPAFQVENDAPSSEWLQS